MRSARWSSVQASRSTAWISAGSASSAATSFSKSPLASRSVDRKMDWPRDRAVAAIAFALQEDRDRRCPRSFAISIQAAIVEAVPLGVGAGVEQQANRVDVAFADREMDGGCVPELGAAERRVPIDQPPEGNDVAL